jgi:hypothetical protein
MRRGGRHRARRARGVTPSAILWMKGLVLLYWSAAGVCVCGCLCVCNWGCEDEEEEEEEEEEGGGIVGVDAIVVDVDVIVASIGRFFLFWILAGCFLYAGFTWIF